MPWKARPSAESNARKIAQSPNETGVRLALMKVGASQHFRSFWGAWRTIAGYEAIHMIRKGQACWSAAGAKVGDWLYELKFDSYRALGFKTGSEVQLFSRNRKLFNDNYPVLVEPLKSLKANFIIDGEITALDQNGRSSFQLL
jgi:ATP dependent DNA ligase domain